MEFVKRVLRYIPVLYITHQWECTSVSIIMNTAMDRGQETLPNTIPRLVPSKKHSNMKKLLIALLLLIAAESSMYAQSDDAEQVAQKIARKMKDSLQLTDQQKDQLYVINMELHNRKTVARQQHSTADALRNSLQRIENERDSLYKPVLTNDQFLLYRQKKRYLISNN